VALVFSQKKRGVSSLNQYRYQLLMPFSFRRFAWGGNGLNSKGGSCMDSSEFEHPTPLWFRRRALRFRGPPNNQEVSCQTTKEFPLSMKGHQPGTLRESSPGAS